jgi:DNA-binding response OmpR family regulator
MKIKKYRILVADDEENIRMLLSETLKDEGYEIIEVTNGDEAVKEVKKSDFDCVLMDVRMPVLDGMEAFLKIREIRNNLPVIFLTAYGSSDLAIKAMKKGAYDYLTKPFDLEELKVKVKKAIELKELTENAPKFEKDENRYISDEIVGNSPKMQEVFKQIGKVAESDATVLIRGEIYTVSDHAINFEIEKKLGNLGVEVYREMSLLYHLKKKIFFKDFFIQRKIKPYLGSTVGGHGRDAIYEMLKYVKEGFDGVIQLLPSFCMPETSIRPILEKIHQETGIPFLSLSLDEQVAEAGIDTRIEAFVDVVKNYYQNKH